MAGAIYCGFARVAVQTLLQKYTSSNNHLLPRWSENVISDYKSDFRGYSRMLLPTDPKNVSKRVMSIRECFGRRWNPADTKVEHFHLMPGTLFHCSLNNRILYSCALHVTATILSRWLISQ